jgi:HAD superfamily hydrolase (TIGR01509 family)
MDGLLLDSERIALSTFVDSCKEHYFEPNMEAYYRCIGTNALKTREILLEGHGKNFPYEAITKLWTKKYHEEALNKPVPMKEGVWSLLQYLKKEGVKRAVVTSTRKRNALIKLSNAKILHFFDIVLGGDQVLNGKPNPEVYLTVSQKLNEPPTKCLALEDSDNGVLAAYNAGLIVMQIPDLKEPSVEIKALGHIIVKSLVEVERILRRLNSVSSS